MHELLTPEEMYTADRLTIEAGTPGIDLMENAGAACTGFIIGEVQKCQVAVVAGPGNNGGDGFVVARLLADRGWPVKVLLAASPDSLKGDAALAMDRWSGEVLPAKPENLYGAELVVDALFGAGLARDIEGSLGELVQAINASAAPVVAIDMPSGIDGATGKVRGVAVAADQTVTFFRAKPGHYLLPGREARGELHVVDIGIAESVLDSIRPAMRRNAREDVAAILPALATGSHKHARGHAVMMSGPRHQTGAARLAATAALRAGAGLVTVLGEGRAMDILAAHLTSVMLRRTDTALELSRFLSDPRITAFGIGPAAGIGQQTRDRADVALAAGCAVVLDADALTSFSGQAEHLFTRIAALPERPVVMTPHEGEFVRLFRHLRTKVESRCELARTAASASGAVMILKGPDTVIAAPDGRCAINDNAPPQLATAGSGDVLTGLCLGLLAQGVPGYEAACAAVWLHGQAASLFGRGLIADDLPDLIPEALECALEPHG